MPGVPGPGALTGVRVLDLADEGAILGTKLLADLGADVLRIEPPAGDPIRRLGPFADDRVDLEWSLSHWWYNAGKRSAVLDTGTADGRARLAELAGEADIVIESAGSGLDVPTLRAAHPAVTVVSVSGFGLTGPRCDWLSSDLISWAIGGAMSTTGLPDRPPLRANWALASHITGLYAAIGGLAGLAHRGATGRGLHFDLSGQEAVASLLISHLQLWIYAQQIQPRVGLGNPLTTIYGDFATSDGWVMLVAITQGQWTTLVDWACEVGGGEEWLRDPALVPSATRNAHRDKINAWITEWVRRWRTADLVREANRRRIPCAAMNTPRDVLDDEQMRARGFFVTMDHPLLGRKVTYAGLPYQIPGATPARPAPRLGADEPRWVAPRSRAAAPADQTVAPAATSQRPLAGLKVLDLTWVLAGPIGTRVLADLGAETIKLEPRGLGDPLRGFAPYCNGQPDPNQSSLFHGVGRNRYGLALDLARPEAVQLIKRLAAWADIVVENFGAGVLRRRGLGPEELFAVRPDLIQVSLSGYGQTGPTAHYPSFAAISEARAGLNYSISYADGVPAGPSIWIGDTGAGLQLAIATLAAVEYRRRTGQGIHIDMSQQESASLFLGPALLDAAVNDRSFVPRGSLLPDRAAALHDAYPARGDARWIAIAVLTEPQWQALIKLMDRPDLAADPRFATASDRVANVAALDEQVAAWTRDQEAHALAERLQAAGIPAGVVQTAADLLEQDPQLATRRFYQMVEQPEVGPIRVSSLPLRWQAGPPPIRLPAPRVGEHNEYVLREVLGLSEEEYIDLVVNDIV